MSLFFETSDLVLHHGHALDVARILPDASVQTIVTSPPYFGLRDYGEDGQIGAEHSPAEYVSTLVELFRELRRVLADDGTLWLNLGDSYYSGRGASTGVDEKNRARRGFVRPLDKPGQPWAQPKNLLGIPWRVAFALQEDGWILRSDIIWHKPNPMPESVRDRPTRSHEYLFLFAKNPTYYYDHEAIAETATGAGSGNGFARPESINRGGIGSDDAWPARPQLARALKLAQEKGLTEEHFSAIRAVGMNDTGKAVAVQTGAGRNAEHVQHLADEAKAALGGYYREFLTGGIKNKRTVWTVPTVPFTGSHFAVYPPELIRPCILSASRPGDLVMDPFSGSGTTGHVATFEGRKYVGIDISREYLEMSLRTRFAQPVLPWGGDAA